MQLTSIEQCKVGMIVWHPVRGKGAITHCWEYPKEDTYCQIEVEFISYNGVSYKQMYLLKSSYPETNLISHLYTDPVYICEEKQQRITSIDLSITAPGGEVLYSSQSNALFTTLTRALSDFKKSVKELITEDPERFKNIILK